MVLEAEEIDTSVRSKNRNAPPVESAYLDIDVLDPDWPLLKVITDKKIMEGTDVGYFGPDAHVTRAQAVTAFIRALGFENIAPFGSAYYIGFSDDHDIPLWAKNSFNVARQIGLVTGDTFGRARPGAYLTREEAASMLSRLITYLRTEILRDYRDRILLYK